MTGTAVLARAGSQTQPVVAMALALTVLGMLLFFGAQGLPEQTFRAFRTPSMFRPITSSQPGFAFSAGTGRLDATALDALAGMEAGAAAADDDGPTGPIGSGRRPAKWWSQRPW